MNKQVQSEFCNFFNYNTYTSLVLPRDWRLSSNPDFAAFYLGPLEQGYVPSLAINIWKMEGAPVGLYTEMAHATVNDQRPQYQEGGFEDLLVDNCPAVAHRFSWFDTETSMIAMQQQVFVQVTDYIYCFTFTTNQAQERKYRPIFEQTLRSVRFIPLYTFIEKRFYYVDLPSAPSQPGAPKPEE